MRGIPGRIEDDDTISRHQVNAETSSLRRDQEEASAEIRFLIVQLNIVH
jgi:hypothetical protein